MAGAGPAGAGPAGAEIRRWEAGHELGRDRPATSPWSLGIGEPVGAVVILAVACILTPVLVLGLLAATLLSLPSFGSMPPPLAPVGSNVTQVYDVNGERIASFQQFETNVPVAPEEIPLVLKQAVVASEDRRFYDHQGVDSRGVMRALWADLSGGRYSQGASTIDEQYVRLIYGDDRRSLSRKAHEAVLAGRADVHLTKDEILYGYLSRVYLGGGAYGVGAAAESYFRKSVRDLSLSEAALLASIIPAPSRYDPRIDPQGADQRRLQVLTKMRAQGFISPTQEAAADEQTFVLAKGDAPPPGNFTPVYGPRPQRTQYPWFVDYVRRYLIARFGQDVVARGGLRVETSLDPDLQAKAEAAVGNAMNTVQPGVEMAMVVLDPQSGLVRAMVGGRDFAKSQVNLALGSCPPSKGLPAPDEPVCIGGGGSGRQPGSAFKPFTLAKAFEEGLDASKVFSGPASYSFPSAQCKGSGCTIHNVESGGYGAINLRQATAYSVNTVFAQLIEKVGVKATAELAHRLGLTMINPSGKTPSGESYGPGLTLGTADVSPLDMAAAYGVFAARGMQFPATPVLRVMAADGTLLEDNRTRQGHQVLPAPVADQVNDVLKGVVAFGTGTAANIGRPQGTAGKTGTAESYSDAWFVGYTPSLATSVWMGYSASRQPLVNIKNIPQVFGGTLPAQTWHDFMLSALADQPEQDFVPPVSALPPPPVSIPTYSATTAPTFSYVPPPSLPSPSIPPYLTTPPTSFVVPPTSLVPP